MNRKTGSNRLWIHHFGALCQRTRRRKNHLINHKSTEGYFTEAELTFAAPAPNHVVSAAPAASAANTVDAILDEYESLINKYVSFMKKVSKGDINALTQIESITDQLETFYDKLDKLDDEMTAEQVSRFTKLVGKQNSAAF